MKSLLLRCSAIAAVILLPLFVSCGGSSSNGPGPGSRPTLTAPTFSPVINVLGSGSAAQAAKTEVQAQVALATALTATPAAFAVATSTGTWGDKIDSSWMKTTTSGSCTTTLKVTDDTASSYHWTRTLNGTCTGAAHNQWLSVNGASSGTGDLGIFHMYADLTTTVDTSWKWIFAADHKTQDWTFYHGTSVDANRIATLHWTKGAGNSNDWTFEQMATVVASGQAAASDPAKWVLHVGSDTKSGSMDIYGWRAAASPDVYYRRESIAWEADSSGSRIQYDENGNVTHTTDWSNRPPTIRNSANIGHDVVINCSDQTAQLAKVLAQSQIDVARAFTSLANSFFAALDSAQWGAVVNGCRTWAASVQSCSWEYQVCETSNGLSWRYKLDGTCGDSTPYHNWVFWDGETSTDGGTGVWHVYENNSAVIQFTVAWTTAEDGKSGTWGFYNGEETAANLEWQISWAENTDGSTTVTYETFGAGKSKTVTHVSADGKSGDLRTYSWDETSSTYWVEEEIIWHADCTGSWITYDEEGTILSEQDWTS